MTTPKVPFPKITKCLFASKPSLSIFRLFGVVMVNVFLAINCGEFLRRFSSRGVVLVGVTLNNLLRKF